MTEPTYACPKCGQPFPMSQLHNHYQSCQGKPIQQQQQPAFPPTVSQWIQTPYGTVQPLQQAPLYVPPTPPAHVHRWSENDTYKVCIAYLYNQAEECREIKVKLRGAWQIFVRYGLKLFVIQLIIAFAVAFSLASAFGVHR